MRRMRKGLLTILLIASLLPLCLINRAYAISEGPSQPEAMQFEPVDTTDLVNLATGDFNYNLPLLIIPGPAGDFPINMSYHAGIGPNEEATWVGLGWSLNPGSINRTLSGYPDDYNGDSIQTHFEAPPESGWGVGIGLGYGPVGLNVTYDSYTGNYGVNALAQFYGMLSISAGSGGINASVGFNKTLGPLKAKASLDIAVDEGFGFSAGLSTLDGNAHVGFTLSTAGSGANYSVFGLGASSMSERGEGHYQSRGFSFFLPTPWGLWASISHSEWSWWLNETYEERSYGYVHQDRYYRDFGTVGAKKYERQKQGNYVYPSQDLYMVQAQGISGAFKPFMKKAYLLKDRVENTQKGELDTIDYRLRNEFNDQVFRFLGDTGANLITDDGHDITGVRGWGQNYQNLSLRRMAGKQIRPIYDEGNTWSITGFVITDVDGKSYEFKQPVRNHVQYSWTNEHVKKLVDRKIVDKVNKSYTAMGTPYATNWLLTAIKGPDYVDRNRNGVCDDDDWGYWVKLSYTVSRRLQIWRTPYQGMGPGATSSNVETASIGARDMVLLDRIETGSHIAEFRKSDRKDRFVAPSREPLDLLGKASQVTRNGRNFTYELKFPGDWKQFLDDAPTNEVLLDYGAGCEGGSADDDSLVSTYQPFSHRKSEMTWRTTGAFTFINVSGRCNLSRAFGPHPTSIKLHIDKLFPATYSVAQKLDEIVLYSKADQNVRKIDNRWEILYNLATPAKAIKFTYDYSLTPNTPNSTATAADGAAGGKVTLKSVEFLGRNKAAGGLPPYVFVYGNGNAPGTGLNPSYNQDDWDNWGSYRNPNGERGIDRGRYVHLTPQNQTRANQAAAWSLTRITTPTGGNINIEYESDDYRHVSDLMDVEHIGTLDADATTGSPVEERILAISLSATDRNSFAVLQSNTSHVNNGTTITPSYAASAGLIPGRQIAIIEQEITRQSNNRTSVARNVTFREVTAVTPQQRVGQPQAIDGYKVTFTGTTYSTKPNSANKSYNYFFKLYPRKIFGGGLRVKVISSSDVTATYRTNYVYEKDGLSTGVTASLPARYGGFFNVNLALAFRSPAGHVADDEWDNYKQLFLQHPKSYGRPAPGVIYSEVAVINVNSQGAPLNGKTVYRFMTAREYPYKVSETNPSLTINDRTGIYGKPISISYYEQTNNSGGFRLSKQEAVFYSFSDQLNTGIYEKDDRMVAQPETKPLGLIHEKYKFHNEYRRGNRGPVYLARQVERLYQNVFIRTNYSQSYYYDPAKPSAPPRVVQNRTRNIGWDSLSGAVIASANTYTNDGKVLVKKIVPAYWKYEGMERKNMLTQTAQETSYLGEERIFSVGTYAFPSDQILSSSVVTWSSNWHSDQRVFPNDVDAPWRQDTTFIYDKRIDLANGSSFSRLPDAHWLYSSDLYPTVTGDAPWRMISNVTRYDVMSHPTEVSHPDGSYTSAIYGQNNALQFAIIKNARRNQFKYFNFEEWRNLEPAQSGHIFFTGGHTGRGVVTAKDRDYNHAYQFSLKENQTYQVSFWARKGNAVLAKAPRLIFEGQGLPATSVNVSRNLQTSDQWEYIEGRITPTQSGTLTMRIICGEGTGPGDNTYHLIDDIRILPNDSTMKTFSYDPYSYAVTSITDENSLTTSYEYDAGGKLVRVRDPDRNIRFRYQYGFGPEQRMAVSGSSSPLDRKYSVIPHNFIKRQFIQTPVVNENQIDRLPEQDLEQVIDYYSGLGKVLQEVASKASPSRRDLVTLFAYDELGKATTSYLPYAAGDGTGDYRLNAFSAQQNFYKTEPQLPHTDFPFAVSVEERSSHRRLLEKGFAGEPWQPASITSRGGHTTKIRYRTNNANEVRLWVWNNAANRFQADNFHAVGQLSAIETDDENGHTIIQYQDRTGRLILKRGLNRDRNNNLQHLDTYYVYDELGNLRFIVPPKSVLAMLGSNQWFIDRTRDTKWVTEFIYDGANRVVEKRVGGGDPLYTVYDRLGRPVLTQDGNLRQTNSWLFIKYDIHGRTIMTGKFQDHQHVTRTAMQAYADSFVDDVNRFTYERRNAMVLAVFDTLHGYTNQAFPAHDPANVLTVVYYDDYDLTNRGSVLTQFLPDPEFAQNFPFYRLKNKVTASKTRVIKEGGQGADLPDWLVEYNYYDKYGRHIQTWARDNQGIRIQNFEYDFSGKIVKQKVSRVGAADALTVRKRLTYDHRGRVLRVYQKINDGPEILISDRKYNELGGLREKNLHSENDGSNFLQSIDYVYNIRGWLTQINDPDAIGFAQAGDAGLAGLDQFGMRLWYDVAGPRRLNNAPQYNGNISAADWAVAQAPPSSFQTSPQTELESYLYSYDQTNQLTEARYRKRSDIGAPLDGDDQYNESVSYDFNGNIQSISRSGLVRVSANGSTFYGPIDDLAYYYRGNQLIGVDDRIQASHGSDFTDKNGSRFQVVGDEYRYDASGNLIEDKNKGMTARYNHLNLPVRMDFGSGNYIEWIYSADGNKLRQTVYTNNSVTRTIDYAADTVYENGTVAFLNTGEGRARFLTGGSLQYEYDLTDHLGNVRVSFTKASNAVTPLVLQQSSYYPFGMKLGGLSRVIGGTESSYAYNGKELQTDHGLNWYDYGARQYDPQLGRWGTMDPSDELVGPYTYVANNPTRLIDPDGSSINVQDLNEADREALRTSLEQKTGFSLGFESPWHSWFSNDLFLVINDGGKFSGGSPEARDILSTAINSKTEVIVKNVNVVFVKGERNPRRIVSGEWIPELNLLALDYKDFALMQGDPEAQKANDLGMVFLHEADHFLSGKKDPASGKGPIVTRLNIVERQLKLPIRFQYAPLTNTSSTSIFQYDHPPGSIVGGVTTTATVTVYLKIPHVVQRN